MVVCTFEEAKTENPQISLDNYYSQSMNPRYMGRDPVSSIRRRTIEEDTSINF